MIPSVIYNCGTMLIQIQTLLSDALFNKKVKDEQKESLGDIILLFLKLYYQRRNKQLSTKTNV